MVEADGPSPHAAFAEQLAEVHRQRRHANEQAVEQAAAAEAGARSATHSWTAARAGLLQRFSRGLWRRWEQGFGTAASRRQRRRPPVRGFDAAHHDAGIQAVRRQLVAATRWHRRLARLPRQSWPRLLLRLRTRRLRLRLTATRWLLRSYRVLLVLVLLAVVLSLLWIAEVGPVPELKELLRELITLARLGYDHG